MNFSKIEHVQESLDIREISRAQNLITNEENISDTKEDQFNEEERLIIKDNNNPVFLSDQQNLIEEFSLEERRLGSLTLQQNQSSTNYIISKKGDAIDDEVDDGGCNSPTPKGKESNSSMLLNDLSFTPQMESMKSAPQEESKGVQSEVLAILSKSETNKKEFMEKLTTLVKENKEEFWDE